MGKRKRATLDGADIIFLDPDNGLGAETAKHATLSEIRLLRRPGAAIVFIIFSGRSVPHDALVRRLHEQLRAEADARAIVTLRNKYLGAARRGIAFLCAAAALVHERPSRCRVDRQRACSPMLSHSFRMSGCGFG